jgi:hypothetical protein
VKPDSHATATCPGPRSSFHIGLGLVAALLFVKALLAVVPTYGEREALFRTEGPQPQQAASVDFNCDGRMDVVWVQSLWTAAATQPIRNFVSDGQGGFSDGS